MNNEHQVPAHLTEQHEHVGAVKTVLSSKRFQEILAQHILSDIPIGDLRLSEAQKTRMKVVKETYMQYMSRPAMTTRQLRNHLRNFHNRTEQQQRDDMSALSFLMTVVQPAGKSMMRTQANARIEEAYEIASSKGDAHMILKSAEAMAKLNDLYNQSPDRDEMDNLYVPEVVITSDITLIDPTRKHYTREEMRKLMKDVGGDDTQFFSDDRRPASETMYEEVDFEESAGMTEERE